MSLFGALTLAAACGPVKLPPPDLVLPSTFGFTGEVQTFRVPAGVCGITVDAFGAQGGDVPSSPSATGGLGGRATGTVAVTPGETLEVEVGGQGGPGGIGPGPGGGGAGGFNGGADGGAVFSIFHQTGAGGGGASDVRRAPFGVDGRLVGAGGGGGAGAGASPPGSNGLGGHGGGTSGTAGTGGPVSPGGGGPGTNTSGGGGGAPVADPPAVGLPGSIGTVGNGGDGGAAASILGTPGPGFGGGGGGGGNFGGGGGGGGAGAGPGGGGGGGSGLGPVGTAFETGVRKGHGQVTISHSKSC